MIVLYLLSSNISNDFLLKRAGCLHEVVKQWLILKLLSFLPTREANTKRI